MNWMGLSLGTAAPLAWRFCIGVVALALTGCGGDLRSEPEPTPLAGALPCLSSAGWNQRIAPDGSKLALATCEGDATVLVDPITGEGVSLAAAEFLTWAMHNGQPIAWLRSDAGVLRASGGELQLDRAATRALASADRTGSWMSTPMRLAAAGEGVVVGLPPSNRYAQIVALSPASSTMTRVFPAQSAGERPIASVQIGPGPDGARVFISAQTLTDDEADAVHHIAAFARNGEVLATAQAPGWEVQPLATLMDGAPAHLSRHEDFLCLQLPMAPCAKDMNHVVLDRRGAPAAYWTPALHASLVAEAGGFAPAPGRIGFIDLTGRAWMETFDGASFNLAIADPRQGVRSLEGPLAAALSWPSAVQGTPIAAGTADGARVHAYLHRPAQGDARALLVLLHGGPYQAYTDLAGDHVKTLNQEGVAVVRANTRGTPGYGRAYLEAAFAPDAPNKSVMDVAALIAAARAALDLAPNAPVLIGGESWGALPALAAAHALQPDGVVLFAGICEAEIDVEDAQFGPGRDAPLSTLANPATAIFQIAMAKPWRGAGLCARALGPVRLAALHASDDMLADYARIASLINAQQPGAMLDTIDGRSHRVTVSHPDRAARLVLDLVDAVAD